MRGRTAGRSQGFTLVELAISLVIGAMLTVSLSGMLSAGLDSRAHASERDDLTQQARFAMQQMTRAVTGATRLLVPLDDNPSTGYPENLREQTVPPSPPPPGSTLASAVLALTVDPSLDLDGDGTPDADNDRDGRIDEDLPGDVTNDFDPGIHGIDDDGDGFIDEGFFFSDGDDDEGSGFPDEDPIDGIDDDGDNNLDEDPPADNNGDGAPGIAGVDDDADGLIDEGSPHDDDEDGAVNEDWLDPVVFFLRSGTLVQRLPVPWDEDGGGGVTGRDFIESPIAERVARFRVERIPLGEGRSVLVDLTLVLAGPSGETVRLNTRVRVGGGR